MSKVCLNCIVKNEADKIDRMLASVVDHIDYYAILDTGSTDGTQKKIRSFFRGRGKRGIVLDGTFTNFEQARNDALTLAQVYAAPEDYIMLVDADMELVVVDPDWKLKLSAHAYDVTQCSQSLDYSNVRLVRSGEKTRYVGVTHEYIDVRRPMPHLTGIKFVDHADGTNRKDKYARDEILLLGALKDDPNNPRSLFYLGQTYRDWGKWKESAEMYKRRVAIPGAWAEETWNAQVNYAECLRHLGDEPGYLHNMLTAFNMRPHRAEPLYDLAKFYREKPSQQALAVLFAKHGMDIPYPKDDHLFVNRYVYTTGLKEEFGIAGFYSADPKVKKVAFQVCDQLSMQLAGTPASRTQARNNLFHYLPKLSDSCPSFAPKLLDFTPPEGYVAMNPSVTRQNQQLYAVIRCVNYRIDEEGRYLIRNTETGEITNDNPIHTRNFLVKLDASLHVVEKPIELVSPLKDPKFPLVVGLEDMRIFPDGDRLLFLACVRETTEAGWCQQAFGEIAFSFDPNTFDRTARVAVKNIMQPNADRHEKNWMPVLAGGQLQAMYRLGESLAIPSCLPTPHAITINADNISGGSQVIPFSNGYLSLVHSAMQRPDGTRYYLHRWAFFDQHLSQKVLSAPFCFLDKYIEFAAGLEWSNAKDLVLSFGFRDREPWIATVDPEEVWEMLWPSQH